jgi:hypothetical protein
MVAKAFGDGLRSGNNYADVDIESVPVDLAGPMTPVRVAEVRLLNCAIAHYGAPATSDIGICGSYPTAHCGAVTATVDVGMQAPPQTAMAALVATGTKSNLGVAANACDF